MKNRVKDNVLLKKLSFTVLVLAVYILGRYVPLYNIDKSWYKELNQNAEHFLGMAIGGDLNRISVLALGISPFMIASIIMMGITAIRKACTRSKFSSDKMKRVLHILTFWFAVIASLFHSTALHFLPSDLPVWLLQGIASAELILGAMLVLWLMEANQEHGIGGQSVLIIVNLIGSLIALVDGNSPEELILPALCALAAMAVTLLMEGSEFRIPVQRIFIYNIYDDKNYIAFKYNPIGVMPLMFSTSVFSVLQFLLFLIQLLIPEAERYARFLECISLSSPVGIGIYIGILYLLSILLSILLLNPSDMAEQMQKSNDSICNVCAGKPTRRYLMRVLILISLFSATVMSLCIGPSLILQMRGRISNTLAMMPSIIMMLTSILMSFFRELKTAVSFESYRIFL